MEQQLAAKKIWRKKRAALPMPEKVKVLEKLRGKFLLTEASLEALKIKGEGAAIPPLNKFYLGTAADR